MSRRPITPDALRAAALQSIQIAPDPLGGIRPGDPLRELIPDGIGATEFTRALVVAEAVAGYEPEIWPTADHAAKLRSQLRRWAVKNNREDDDRP